MRKTLVALAASAVLGTSLAPTAAHAAPDKRKTQPCNLVISGPWEHRVDHIVGTVLYDCAAGITAAVRVRARVVEMQERYVTVRGSRIRTYVPKAVGAMGIQLPAMTAADFTTVQVRGLCSGTNRRGNWYAISGTAEAVPANSRAHKPRKDKIMSDLVRINCTDSKFGPRAGTTLDGWA